MGKTKIKVIDGIRYYAERPNNCRYCYFWKNRKTGCILRRENCYYLAEKVKSEQEKECENCCYAKGRPCVSAGCYKEQERWLQARRKAAKKAGDADACMPAVPMERTLRFSERDR